MALMDLRTSLVATPVPKRDRIEAGMRSPPRNIHNTASTASTSNEVAVFLSPRHIAKQSKCLNTRAGAFLIWDYEKFEFKDDQGSQSRACSTNVEEVSRSKPPNLTQVS